MDLTERHREACAAAVAAAAAQASATAAVIAAERAFEVADDWAPVAAARDASARAELVARLATKKLDDLTAEVQAVARRKLQEARADAQGRASARHLVEQAGPLLDRYCELELEISRLSRQMFGLCVAQNEAANEEATLAAQLGRDPVAAPMQMANVQLIVQRAIAMERARTHRDTSTDMEDPHLVNGWIVVHDRLDWRPGHRDPTQHDAELVDDLLVSVRGAPNPERL